MVSILSTQVQVQAQISNYQTLTESVGATQDHRTSCLGRLVKDFLVSDQLHLHTDIGGKNSEPGWGWVGVVWSEDVGLCLWAERPEDRPGQAYSLSSVGQSHSARPGLSESGPGWDCGAQHSSSDTRMLPSRGLGWLLQDKVQGSSHWSWLLTLTNNTIIHRPDTNTQSFIVTQLSSHLIWCLNSKSQFLTLGALNQT